MIGTNTMGFVQLNKYILNIEHFLYGIPSLIWGFSVFVGKFFYKRSQAGRSDRIVYEVLR